MNDFVRRRHPGQATGQKATGRVITARRNGLCPQCEGRVAAGRTKLIKCFASDQWVHVGCLAPATERASKG